MFCYGVMSSIEIWCLIVFYPLVNSILMSYRALPLPKRYSFYGMLSYTVLNCVAWLLANVSSYCFMLLLSILVMDVNEGNVFCCCILWCFVLGYSFLFNRVVW